MCEYNKYGDVYVTVCFDSGIERENESGETEICEGYFCQVYSDPAFEDEIDYFCIAVGHEINDLSDAEVEKGIRCYLRLNENYDSAVFGSEQEENDINLV